MRLLPASVEVLIDPFAQLVGGSGTAEPTAFLAVLKQDNGWETT